MKFCYKKGHTISLKTSHLIVILSNKKAEQLGKLLRLYHPLIDGCSVYALSKTTNLAQN